MSASPILDVDSALPGGAVCPESDGCAGGRSGSAARAGVSAVEEIDDAALGESGTVEGGVVLELAALGVVCIGFVSGTADPSDGVGVPCRDVPAVVESGDVNVGMVE